MTTTGIGSGIPQNYKTDIATIPADGTKSNTIDCAGLTLSSIQLPATFTGATITFEATLSSDPEATLVPVRDDIGDTYIVTVGTSRIVTLDLHKMAGLRRIKLVSASTEAAAREVFCALRVI